MRPAATTTALVTQLGPDTGWARCGIVQLATRESDLAAWEWMAERASGATEISADDVHAMVPVVGAVVRTRCTTHKRRVSTVG